MAKEEKIGILYVIIAGICWGVIGIFTRQLSAFGLNSIIITFLRTFFAAIELAIFIFFKERTYFKIKIRDLWIFLGTGICSVAFFNICYFKAISMTTMSIAAILLYTAPSMVMVMSAIIFKEKMTMKKLVALIIAFTGCLFITGIMGNSQTVNGKGMLIGLGAGFGYALYSIFGTFGARKYEALTITFYTFVFASIGVLPLVIKDNSFEGMTIDLSLIVISILLATVSTVVPFLLYTKGLQALEAGKASIMAFIEPVVATICGIVFFHEKITVLNSIGIVLVFISIVLLNSKTREGKKV